MHDPIIFIVAGEPSGDFLGAQLIKALKKKAPNLSFFGMGGPLMIKEGFNSIILMEKISFMGLIEILKKIFIIQYYLKFIVNRIIQLKPDIIVTIDFPGFNFRLAKKIKYLNIPLIHYVAPSVWAWKTKRADKIALLYEHLLCLFPFEQKYFPKIKTTFVGHPVVENYTNRLNIKINKKFDKNLFITVLPGSRAQEVKRHLPIFIKALSLLKKPIFVFVPTLEHLKSYVENWMYKNTQLPFIIVTDKKFSAFRKSKAALCASGTVTLELAKFSLPCVVAYKVSKITAFFIKRLIKIPYISLINILSEKKIVPELLQEKCKPELLSHELKIILKDADKIKESYKNVIRILEPSSNKLPSEIAAQVILSYLQ